MAPSSIDGVSSAVREVRPTESQVQAASATKIQQSINTEIDTGEVSPSAPDAPPSEITDIEAKAIAEDIRRALKAVGSTIVTFEPFSTDGGHVMKFRVVDEKTGEVIREFPPEIGKAIQKQLDLKEGKGILLEKSI